MACRNIAGQEVAATLGVPDLEDPIAALPGHRPAVRMEADTQGKSTGLERVGPLPRTDVPGLDGIVACDAASDGGEALPVRMELQAVDVTSAALQDEPVPGRTHVPCIELAKLPTGGEALSVGAKAE